MKGVGVFLIIASVLSLLLPFVGLQLRIFMWIDAWGLPMGLLIRLGIAVMGGVIFWLAREEGTSVDI